MSAARAAFRVLPDGAPAGEVKKGEILGVLGIAGDKYLTVVNRKPGFVSMAATTMKQHVPLPGLTRAQDLEWLEGSGSLVAAKLYTDRQEFAKALPFVVKGATLFEKLLGAQDSFTAMQITKLGTAYSRVGEYRNADKHLSRGVAIMRQLAEPPEVFAVSLSNLANVRGKLAKYDEALKLYAEALRLARQISGSRKNEALVLNGLAVLESQLGRYAEADRKYAEVLSITKQANGADSVEYASALNNIAVAASRRGDLNRARVAYEDSIEIYRKKYGDESPGVALGQTNLAQVLYQLGDEKAAIEMAGQAYLVFSRKLGDHARTVAAARALAVYYRRTDAEKSHRYAQAAYKTAARTFGENHPQTLAQRGLLSVSYAFAGMYDEAITELKATIEKTVSQFGRKHPSVEQLNRDLLGVYVKAKQYGEATTLIEAHKQYPVPKGEVISRDSRAAALYCVTGRQQPAFAAASSARAMAGKFTGETLPRLNRVEQLKFIASDRNSLDTALSVVLKMKPSQTVTDAAATWVLNAKGRGNEALAYQNQLRKEYTDPASKKVVDELIVVQRRLAEISARKAFSNRTESQDITRALEVQETELLRNLNRQSEDRFAIPSVTLNQVQQRLPANAVLLEIVRLEPQVLDPEEPLDKTSPAIYLAFVITRDKPVAMVNLGSAANIEKEIDAVRKSLDLSLILLSRKDYARAEAMVAEPLSRLSALLYTPLSEHVSTRPQIILNPDSALWLLPWENLLVAKGKYAVEQHLFRYVHSSRSLVHRPKPVKSVSAPLLVGDPAYDFLPPVEGDEEGDTRSVRMLKLKSPGVSRLPASRAEILASQPLIESRYKVKAKVLLDKTASEDNIKKAIRPALLYLSTHGYFTPAPSRKPERGLSFGLVKTSTAYAGDTQHPLLNCGVCLASCNHNNEIYRRKLDIDDGVLTGKEILSLDLNGADLVVLSACETGVGQLQNAEGVAGLRQAFHLAGAKQVIGTSWSVMDRETALLMLLFFKYLKTNPDKSLALKRAQVKLIQNLREQKGGASPLYWGAFSISYK